MSRERRHKGEGSVYQRASDGRWVCTLDVGHADGKRVRKTVTATTLTALRPKMRALQREVEAGVLSDAMTVETWLTHWLDTIASRRVRPKTLDGYESYVARWLVPQLGHHRLDRLKPEHVRLLHRAMQDAGKSDATCRQAHAILRRALVIAEREGRIIRNPAALVDPPPVGRNHRTPLTLDEARKVLHSLDATVDPAAASRWQAALLLGIRQGEALGLRWDDVDLTAPCLHIRQTVQRQKGKGLVVVPPKSKTSTRTLPLLPELVYSLAEHARNGTVGYVWGGPDPTPPEQDWRAWKTLLAEAGVPPVALHAARSTTASLLDEAGVSAKVISEILGHAQVAVTDSYIHGNEQRHRDAMLALSAHVRG